MNKAYSIDRSNRRIAICCRLLIAIMLIPVTFFLTNPSLNAQDKKDEIDTGLKFSGDFRLRYEFTKNDNPGNPLFEARHREVVRLRAGITKRMNRYINFGARLATGDPNDPNTADVTLGDFVNDLTVSLDRAYIELLLNDFFATGGKIPNPFMATDLVWDGDVNPTGAAARYTLSGAGQITPKVTGIYFIINENSRTDIKDTKMLGGQAEINLKPSSSSSVRVAGSYYDYDITNLVSADAGDYRSNYVYVDSTGLHYLSDFDLLDILATINLPGFGPRFPISVVADYVKNLGIADTVKSEDTGFSIDLFVGKASKKNDMRFRYGYSETGTDAVLAAFSHDNTTIATNYQQHTVTAEFVALENTTFDLTWYYYHKKKLATEDEKEGDWISRLRLNAVVKF